MERLEREKEANGESCIEKIKKREREREHVTNKDKEKRMMASDLGENTVSSLVAMRSMQVPRCSLGVCCFDNKIPP